MAVALVALDATVQLLGSGGESSLPLEALHRLPGDEPARDTVIEPGELIVSVTLPALELARNSSYTKVRERASFAFALVSVAAGLEVSGGVVRDVRLALGGVAHKPWRAHRAEAILRGAPVSEETFTRAAEAELQAAEPLPGNAYKVPLARNVIADALLALAGAG
jgi:xanthine dehydrogenase YagS FAD-binding subunit